MNRSHVELTCQQLVHQLTAIPDPTAGGALAIQLHTDGSSAAVTTSQIPIHSILVCGVTTGSRKLTGSLIALGRQPIPWA